MKKICFKFAELNVCVKSDFDRMSFFLLEFFKSLLLDPNSDLNLDVCVNILEHKGSLREFIKSFSRQAGFDQIGASTYFNKAQNSIVFFRKIERKRKIVFEASFKDNKFVLNAYLQSNNFLDFKKQYFLLSKKHDWFFTMTYYLVYYPMFWYMENVFNRHLLHASAVNNNGRGIVVCGLENVGKTSLALKFIDDNLKGFLSDNLIFYDKNKVYPCYELVRLHKDENIGLWSGQFEKVENLELSKDLYRPNFDISVGIKPDVLVFPEFAPEFSIEEISASEASRKAVSLSQIPSELSNYSEFRHLFGLLDLSQSNIVSMYEASENMFKDTKNYIVRMSKKDGLQESFLKIRDFINNESKAV